MTSPTTGPAGRLPLDRLTLDFPRSLAVYDTYEDAQRAVDFLSDAEFPVQNVMIVGTDLKQVERVTGRLTWGKILTGGVLSGMWLGLFVGLIMSMFGTQASWVTFVSALVTGALFGLVWAGLGYSFTRGRRDFTSVSQVVATRYEVLVEHALYERGRETLSQLPGGGAPARPATDRDTPARPNPYEGRYGVRTDGASAAAPRPAEPRPVPSADERGARQAPAVDPYEGRYGVRTETPGAADPTEARGGASAAQRPAEPGAQDPRD